MPNKCFAMVGSDFSFIEYSNCTVVHPGSAELTPLVGSSNCTCSPSSMNLSSANLLWDLSLYHLETVMSVIIFLTDCIYHPSDHLLWSTKSALVQNTACIITFYWRKSCQFQRLYPVLVEYQTSEGYPLYSPFTPQASLGHLVVSGGYLLMVMRLLYSEVDIISLCQLYSNCLAKKWFYT